MTQNENQILGLILAGGLSKRMGGVNKSLVRINDKTLLELVYKLVKKQLSKVVINSNLNLKKEINMEYWPDSLEPLEQILGKKPDIKIIPDKIPGYLGPLSGIFSGMKWAKKNLSECKWIASFPVDSIFFPENFIETMINNINDKTQVACAKSNGRIHPVFALWSLELIDDLEKALTKEGIRKIDEWTSRYNLEVINFKNIDPSIDPFFNINTKEDLKFVNNSLFFDINLSKI